MIIFEPVQHLLLLLGLHEKYSTQSWYRYYKYFMYLLNASLFIPMIIFCFESSDIFLVFEALAVVANNIICLVKGFVYIVLLDQVHTLIFELQSLVDEQERLGRIKHYATQNKATNRRAKCFIVAIFMCVVLYCIAPVLPVLYHNMKGDLTDDMYRQPLYFWMPFDHYRPPAYAPTYVFCFLSVISIALTVTMSDCMFMGQCGIIIAAQIDLQDMLSEIVDDERSKIKVVDKDRLNDIDKRLVECVVFHQRIYKFSDMLGTISSPIISAQMAFSITQLGTLILVLQMNVDTEFDRLIGNGMSCVALLFDLLIYCYYGDEVKSQGLNIADAIYASSWYKCPPKQRRYFLLMLLRAQQPQVIKAFDLIDCSLYTFGSILNLVGSAVTFMRSVA